MKQFNASLNETELKVLSPGSHNVKAEQYFGQHLIEFLFQVERQMR
jgi:hypothetical protein